MNTIGIPSQKVKMQRQVTLHTMDVQKNIIVDLMKLKCEIEVTDMITEKI